MQFKKSGQIVRVKPHTSLVTRQKLLELGWDVLLHPPYSPDLAPSDFHLFRSILSRTIRTPTTHTHASGFCRCSVVKT
ncbi:Histone-lysine N-methyltransferase SETMAR [Habropoda laboriosa]|uniref:Histone-lysine N-methyltransferase SETMAR n=1 Tax=Habropoda laboriosa TaxID=597456 RepID=A0A0L7R801_9HYME|nr:Histone-lysine N-methyltransferase SETMAR [Habropoda laboriosa]